MLYCYKKLLKSPKKKVETDGTEQKKRQPRIMPSIENVLLELFMMAVAQWRPPSPSKNPSTLVSMCKRYETGWRGMESSGISSGERIILPGKRTTSLSSYILEGYGGRRRIEWLRRRLVVLDNTDEMTGEHYIATAVLDNPCSSPGSPRSKQLSIWASIPSYLAFQATPKKTCCTMVLAALITAICYSTKMQG